MKTLDMLKFNLKDKYITDIEEALTKAIIACKKDEPIFTYFTVLKNHGLYTEICNEVIDNVKSKADYDVKVVSDALFDTRYMITIK
jgi:hypothetical protein